MCLTDSVECRLGRCSECCGQTDQHSDSFDQSCIPKYSSPITMVQKVSGVDRKFRVLLKVYTSMYDHYAVVSQDRAIVKDCGYVKLKNCTILGNEKDLTIQVVRRNCEGLTLTFVTSDLVHHRCLMAALQSPQNDDSSSLSDSGEESEGSDKENCQSSALQGQRRTSVPMESRLQRIMWKRDLSPRSSRPGGGRKSSMPSLAENEELESE